MTGSHAEGPPVLVERRGRLGSLTLNRPRSMNALTHEMVTVISEALESWTDDSSIETIVVRGAGDRGLCAGGDIVSLYRDATEGDGTASARFWADEYALNARIAHYPKPYVAIQDGIVLGGGIGISAHGSHRIVTERSRLGFPEVTIGYIPDVGATWLLGRAGAGGMRIALSGEHVGAQEAISLGLADTYVRANAIEDLLVALEDESVDDVIARFSEAPPEGRIDLSSHWVGDAFARESVPQILDDLRKSQVDEAFALADLIEAKSPTALSVTHEAIRRAHRLPDLEAALAMEYRVSLHALGTSDFVEGIRAQVIDKDRQPKWDPSSLEKVDSQRVDDYFQVPERGDLSISRRDREKEDHR